MARLYTKRYLPRLWVRGEEPYILTLYRRYRKKEYENT